MGTQDYSKEWRNESEERLRAFIESAPRKMWISRPDGSVEFFNREWREYTGQTDASGNRTWKDAVHPDDLPRLKDVRNRAVSQGQPYDVQVRLKRHGDGAYRWHIGRVAPVHLHGRLIAWIGAATDIDKRLRAEAALRESEANFRTMADAIPQLAWMRNPNDQSLWFNQRWFEFTGTSMEQMQKEGWQPVIHPEHVDRMTEVVEAARAADAAWEYTVPIRRKDGAYRWFLFRAVPIRDESSGVVTRWFGTSTDVNEQQEAQERQRLLTQEVSHRVKNSLALVAAQLSLQARASDDDDAKKVLMDAYTRVLTIAGVHDHLWRQYDSKFIEIGGFLRDLCHKLQETAPTHEIVFNGGRIVIPTDQAVPIGLVVNELITNALKYAYPEKRRGTVWVTLRKGDDDSLTLEVFDRGIGLPDGFDLSAPTKSLGMRLLVNTVRQIDATVTAMPADPGTRFEINIPMRRE
ncbi:sensor histidine kinase [Azospirillum soli]|uniref:sensor histidine kinase n=1 Tax=Azospirillum soli TaxID=1304799 RepID=UPI001AE4DFCD|nr:PAS domain S-box protein [Azospirillum soli]MBP2312885.1 PAS domain S-box-containing protein [Azospirillum soli]